jgi:tight adherence protein B
MSLSVLENSFLVMAVLVFVTVLLVLESLYLMWRSARGPEATKLQQRIKALSVSRDHTSQTQLLKQRMLSDLPAVDRVLQRLPRLRTLDRFILQSGLNWTVAKLLSACIILGVVALFAVQVFAHQSFLWGLAAAVVFGAIPVMYVRYMRIRRMAKIERQLPDTLDLITRALRAGHAFPSALKMSGEEMAQPIAGEFSTVHDEINFGVSLQQALSHLCERVPITDLRYFVVAVLTQRESGGNLTEILGNLSHLVRERLKLMAKVRVLSSDAKLSAWILGLMPFFLGAVMSLLNPEFMKPLWTDPIGISIIRSMLIVMLVGVFIMRKIVRIRV